MNPCRSGDGWRWTVAPHVSSHLPLSFFEDLEGNIFHPHHKILKDSPVRRVVFLPGPKGELFCKYYKIKTKDKIKGFLVPSKARREWAIAKKARDRGIPTPTPLAMAERRRMGLLQEAIFIAEAITPSSPLVDLIPKGMGKDLWRGAAALIKNAHEVGFFHQDLHAGNILVDTRGYLYLIDLHRARFYKRVSRRRRLWNLAQFFYSLKGHLSQEEKETFLRSYGADEGAIREIERLERRLFFRHMESRTKRCLKDSGGFFFLKEGEWRIWGRRGWQAKELLKLVARHQDTVTKGGKGLLKVDSRTAITLFPYKKAKICVKGYRYVGLWGKLKDILRGAKARRGWVMGNGLAVRGLGGIFPIALLERRWGGLPQEAFLIMETPHGYMELDRYLVREFGAAGRDQNKLRALIEAFSRFMAFLYSNRIHHLDLKTCNIMVCEQGRGWVFGLVDWDDVRLGKMISRRNVIKALMQLNTSTPLFISRRERLWFLARYLKEIGEGDLRDVSQGVIRESKGRSLVYVSPTGDVVVDVDWQACRFSGRGG